MNGETMSAARIRSVAHGKRSLATQSRGLAQRCTRYFTVSVLAHMAMLAVERKLHVGVASARAKPMQFKVGRELGA